MKDTMNKILKWVGIILGCAAILIPLGIAVTFMGNPVSALLAQGSSRRYLEENFPDRDFQIAKSGYNFKTGNYYAYIQSPSSQDSHFTVYFDGWGRYQYDTYDSVVNRSTTLSRLDEQYRELVKSALPYEGSPFDISIAFGELKVAELYEVYSYTDVHGNVQTYTLDKGYGLQRSQLVLDGEYDIFALGRDYGSICLYIHDPEVTTQRAAELLQEVKAYLDSQGVPFHAIDFQLCEPRNEDGQNVGKQITLFQFLCSDIREDGLPERVEQHWLIAQEHFAIQDGIKANEDPLFIEKFEIS